MSHLKSYVLTRVSFKTTLSHLIIQIIKPFICSCVYTDAEDRGGKEEGDEFPPRTKQFLFFFVFFRHMACRVPTSIIDISFLLCLYCGLKPHWGCQISKYSSLRAPRFTHRRLDIRATRIYMASACVFKNVNNFRHVTHTHAIK